MVFVCEPPIVRRKGLLGKLKNLVDAIDDAPNSPNPCMPCCMPCCPPPCVPCCPPPCMPVCCPPACPPCCPPACPPVCPPACPPVCPPACPPPCCPPMCIPKCSPCPPGDRPCVPCSPPDAMICFKRPGLSKGGQARVGTSKSRELLSGVLYTGCLCEKRNGLQDDCPRKECRGRPECLVKPNPTCGPSEFANGKHLGKNSGSGSGGQNLEEYQCFPLAGASPPCGPCC